MYDKKKNVSIVVVQKEYRKQRKAIIGRKRKKRQNSSELQLAKINVIEIGVPQCRFKNVLNICIGV